MCSPYHMYSCAALITCIRVCSLMCHPRHITVSSMLFPYQHEGNSYINVICLVTTVAPLQRPPFLCCGFCVKALAAAAVDFRSLSCRHLERKFFLLILCFQVRQVVQFTWVQPRVLDRAQISTLHERWTLWCHKVQQTVDGVETQAPELVA